MTSYFKKKSISVMGGSFTFEDVEPVAGGNTGKINLGKFPAAAIITAVSVNKKVAFDVTGVVRHGTNTIVNLDLDNNEGKCFSYPYAKGTGTGELIISKDAEINILFATIPTAGEFDIAIEILEPTLATGDLFKEIT